MIGKEKLTKSFLWLIILDITTLHLENLYCETINLQQNSNVKATEYNRT